jgi:GTP cyclohydrolase I
MDHLEALYAEVLSHIEKDPHREGLKGTPHRAAQTWRYLTSGYHMDLTKLINSAIFTSEVDQMILVNNIEFYSVCEHHLLPFFGKCHVAYVPQGKVLGLSKIARIVELFSRRLQIQEELTSQIAHCIEEAVNADGVGVIMEARHMCMMMRGVAKQSSEMKTSVMLGSFRDDKKTRDEFLALLDH